MNISYPAHDPRELLELSADMEKAMKHLLRQFNARQIKLSELLTYKRIFLFILTRAIKTYSSVLILCRQGYGQDVSTLLRGLLELLITAKYIIHDPKTANEKAARFVAYKWIIFKRHLPEQGKDFYAMDKKQKQEFLEKKELVSRQVESFKKKFKIISDRALITWSGKTVRDMAKEVNNELLFEYENNFRLCSRFSHPSILGDREYLVQDGQKLIFSPLPASIGIIPNLKSAIKYAWNFLGVIDELFNFQYHNELAA